MNARRVIQKACLLVAVNRKTKKTEIIESADNARELLALVDDVDKETYAAAGVVRGFLFARPVKVFKLPEKKPAKKGRPKKEPVE